MYKNDKQNRNPKSKFGDKNKGGQRGGGKGFNNNKNPKFTKSAESNKLA